MTRQATTMLPSAIACAYCWPTLTMTTRLDASGFPCCLRCALRPDRTLGMPRFAARFAVTCALELVVDVDPPSPATQPVVVATVDPAPAPAQPALRRNRRRTTGEVADLVRRGRELRARGKRMGEAAAALGVSTGYLRMLLAVTP